MHGQGRGYYKELFVNYPDVVDTLTLREMLGGVSEGFVLRLLLTKTLGNFKVLGKRYMIPKEYVIDYVISDAYQSVKHRLKNQI